MNTNLPTAIVMTVVAIALIATSFLANCDRKVERALIIDRETVSVSEREAISDVIVVDTAYFKCD